MIVVDISSNTLIMTLSWIWVRPQYSYCVKLVYPEEPLETNELVKS